MSSAVVLSYGDICLYQEDVSLLEGRNWLNDKLIGFMYQFYENEAYKRLQSDVLFMSPELVQFIKLSNDSSDLAQQVESLKASEKKYIFIPVNDSMSFFEISGSHWSLLVYSKEDREFTHFDSYGQSNSKHAQIIADKLASILQGDCSKIQFTEEKEAPQQHNSYDCGIFLLCFTEQICNNLQYQHLEKENIFCISNDISAVAKRKEISNLIEKLRKI